MHEHEGTSEIRRVASDFLLVFTIVCGLVLAAGPGHSPAHAVPLPQIDSQAILEGSSRIGPHTASAWATPAWRHEQAERGRTHVLLSIALAAIAAMNLAFWRHLRRAYASPRRKVWRRG